MARNVLRATPTEVSLPSSAPPLTGGTAVWVFMAVEVVTFSLFLLVFAAGWRAQPDVYAAAQALLHPDSGLRGTVLLMLGSGTAYGAVVANRGDQVGGAAARWTTFALALTALLGVAFSVNKVLEYRSPSLAGVSLSTSPFWFTYLFLTGLHLLHVVGGVLAFGWLAVRANAGAYGAERPETVEAAAAYWHLVDVVWLLVFPVVYLMHPGAP